MSELTSKSFWEATAERTVRTFAQTLAGTGLANASGIIGVDWGDALSVSGLAGLLTVLTCVASSAVGNAGPSLTTETTQPASRPAVVKDAPR